MANLMAFKRPDNYNPKKANLMAVEPPNNFNPRQKPLLVPQRNSKKRGIHLSPSSKLVPLQYQHLCLVPLPSTSTTNTTTTKTIWWPCLVFGHPRIADEIIKDTAEATGCYQLHDEYLSEFIKAAKNGMNLTTDSPVTILLGTPPCGCKRAYFNNLDTCSSNNNNNSKIEFTSKGSAFMRMLTKEMIPSIPTTPGLESAVNETEQILKYFMDRNTAASMATEPTTTTATQLTNPLPPPQVIEQDSTLQPSPCKKSRSIGPGGMSSTTAAANPISMHETNDLDSAEKLATAADAAGSKVSNEQAAAPATTTTTSSRREEEEEPEEEGFCPAGAEGEDDEMAADLPSPEPPAAAAKTNNDQDTEPVHASQSLPESEESGSEGSTVSCTTTTSSSSSSSSARNTKAKKGATNKSPNSGNPAKQTPESNQKGKRKNYKETGELVEIPRWAQVCGILEDCGYEFEENLFARAFGNPKRNKAATLGDDYFETEESFRSFVCARGFDYVSAPPQQEDQDVVNAWSRYSILGDKYLTANERNQKLPELQMSRTTANGLLLKKLGFKYIRRLTEGYQCPGDEETMLLEDKDMWTRLARFGLPEACTFEKVEDMELLAVLQCIIDTHTKKYDPVFEERIDPQVNDPPLKDTNDAGESRGFQSTAYQMTPEVDSEAIADCNRAPDAVSPGNARNNLGRNFDKQAPDSQVPSGKTTDSTKNSEPSHPVNEAAATEFDKNNAASIRAGDEPNATQEFIPPSAEVASQVVLSGKTVEEKLQSCLDAMKVGYNDELVVGGSLSAALGRVGCFMKEVVDSRGLRKNAFLHICGAPGVGKTMGVRACEKKMGQHWNDQKGRSIEKAHLEAPKYVFLKGSEFQNLSKARAMQKTFYHIGGSAKQLRRPHDLDRSSKSAVILILDEIDMLISRPGTEEYLRTLVGYAADENMRLGLIGISNSVDNAGLNEVGFIGSRIVFRTYDKEDLVSIITSKVGLSVVDERMIAFLASKVAATSGDARTMLGLVASAIEACREKLPKATLSAVLSGPVVKMPHAMMAVKKQNPKVKDLIESLPQFEKYTLCCGVNLSRARLGQELTLGRLFNDCIYAFGIECQLTIEDFKLLLERLIDKGLLKLENGDHFSGVNSEDLKQIPLRFDLQLEDVVFALAEGIEKEGFYQRIKERCQEIKS